MNTTKTFTTEMITGNSITWAKKAEISHNGTTITIQQYKDEPASVWVSTSTTYNRIAKDIELNEAVKIANNILLNI
jgi:hypothetical protein